MTFPNAGAGDARRAGPFEALRTYGRYLTVPSQEAGRASDTHSVYRVRRPRCRVVAGVGLGAHAGKSQVKTIGSRDTAIFTGQDLICVNGSAVACSSYASPYRGIGMFITRETIQVAR